MRINHSYYEKGCSSYISDFSFKLDSNLPFEIVIGGNDLINFMKIHIPDFQFLDIWIELACKKLILLQNYHNYTYLGYILQNNDDLNLYCEMFGEYTVNENYIPDLYETDPVAYKQLFAKIYKDNLSKIRTENKYYLFQEPIYGKDPFWTITDESMYISDKFTNFNINFNGVEHIANEIRNYLEKYFDRTIADMNNYIINNTNQNRYSFSLKDYEGKALDEVLRIETDPNATLVDIENFMKTYFPLNKND